MVANYSRIDCSVQIEVGRVMRNCLLDHRKSLSYLHNYEAIVTLVIYNPTVPQPR
jgi:hypothetical protein